MTATTGVSRQHFNYAVRFSDRTVKTGITTAPFYRLQDYLQEARRHGKTIIGFLLTPPSRNEAAARRIEATVCEAFADNAIDGHREWFRADLSGLPPAMRTRFHSLLPDVLFDRLRDEWEKENKVDYLLDRCRARRDGRTPRREVYERIADLASELAGAGRISAARATSIAREMGATL